MNPAVHTAEVLPRRALLFLGIVAIHVVIVNYLASGLLRVTRQLLLPEPIKAEILPAIEKPMPKPVEIEPKLERPTTIPLHRPDVPDAFDIPPEPDTTLMTTPELPAPSALDDTLRVAMPPPPPIRVLGRHSLPNSEDYYPAHLRRTRVEGTTQVRTCVDERGKLSGIPKVEQSSGSPELDAAAVRIARDGRYARAMRGEMSVPNCYGFRITFTLD